MLAGFDVKAFFNMFLQFFYYENNYKYLTTLNISSYI